MEQNYDFMQEVSVNIAKDDADDLLHCVIEQMLNKDETYEDFSSEEIRWTFLKIMKLNYHSVTSRYHYLIRKQSQSYNEWDDSYYNVPTDQLDEKMVFEERLQEINNALSELHWFHKVLFNRYWYEGRSYNELAEITGIPVNTIATSVRNTKKYLKEKLR
jgi:RNA polymerase sigma factor (sigma-70 family)